MSFLNLRSRIRQCLKEDGAFRDITTRTLPGAAQARIKVKILAKQPGVFCGAFLLRPIFSLLDPNAKISLKKKDKSSVKKGQTLAVLSLSTKAAFAGERLFLNLASRLSGIATLTQAYVRAVRSSKAKILDTRKTTPLWRDMERYAVHCGGGENHRFNLEDAILVKDNHIQYLRNRGQSVTDVYGSLRRRKTKGRKFKFVEVEAKSYKDVWDGIKSGADIVMLDNMTVAQMRGAVRFIRAARVATASEKPLIEVSGGVTLKKARTLARLGVDRISVGALTHSAPALDLSLEVLSGHI